MEKLQLHRIKSTVSILLLALISFTLLSKAFFIHTHVTSDGQIVAHAHPFQKSDAENQKSSNHTHSDFDLFSWLTYESFEDNSEVVDIALPAFSIESSLVPLSIGVYSNTQTHTQGRAPPAMA